MTNPLNIDNPIPVLSLAYEIKDVYVTSLTANRRGDGSGYGSSHGSGQSPGWDVRDDKAV